MWNQREYTNASSKQMFLGDGDGSTWLGSPWNRIVSFVFASSPQDFGWRAVKIVSSIKSELQTKKKSLYVGLNCVE